MNKEINKIIVIGQLLRDDYTSCEWIYKLFKYYLETVTDLPVFCAVPINYITERNKNFIPIDIKKIYNSFNVFFEYSDDITRWAKGSEWYKSWAEVYYKTEYNEEAYNYIYNIFKNSLVISYEIEDCISAIFKYYDIAQIDINMDPIRFLEDAMLCFKTSNKRIYKKLLQYKIEEEYIYLSANYLKTNYSVGVYPENVKTVLFLGQTECDKTLIDKDTNKIYSILEHKTEFEEAIKGYDKILYKRHPFATNDTKILEYIKSLGNVEITTENFYKLMANDSIEKVVSISSGTCNEAKYFGKEVQTLLREGVVRQTENKFDKNKYVSIYQNYFSLNFWSDILSPIIKTKKYKKEITIAGQKNKLRHSRIKFPIYWSYEDFEQEKIKQDINQDLHKIKQHLWLISEYLGENNE